MWFQNSKETNQLNLWDNNLFMQMVYIWEHVAIHR